MVINRYYKARGELHSLDWGNGATSHVYWPDGKVNYQARSNGVTTTYGYNGRGMIGSVSHTNASNQSLAYREYWRDERDRVIAWKRGIGGPNGMEDGRGDRYRYDPEGQLVRAWYRAQNPETENPGDPKRGDEFQYDALRNRAGTNRVASRGVMNFERKNNKLNQYRGWWPYSITNYDEDLGGWGESGEANGVMMQDGWITASFNALNQPMGIWASPYGWGESAQWMWFGHDALGRCVKRWMGTSAGVPVGSSPATYFYYDGWSLAQEGNAAGYAARLYVHGDRIDEIVKSVNYGNGQSAFHHYDARGHCILLSNMSGGILEQYDYDAFGLPYFYNAAGAKQGPQAYGNRFLFTGREYLSDLKIYDYRNRMYQPELGRFLQPDPKQFGAGDYNLYRYCHNDPVNKNDPTGLHTAIQIGIGTDDNPFGHVAVATTGEGVRSLGTGTPAGSNFSAYLGSQATYRNSVVYVVPTNREQENRINESLNGQKETKQRLPEAKKEPIAASRDNCTTRTSDALNAGDVKVGNNRVPAELQRKLDNMVTNGEATKYNVPRDSKPNDVWRLFDKKP